MVARVAKPNTPTRKQLAAITGGDIDLLRSFEELFDAVNTAIPILVENEDAIVSAHIADDNNPHVTSLGNLDDTATISATGDQSLIYNSVANKWINGEARYAFAETNPTGLINGGEVNIGPVPNDVEITSGLGIVINTYTDPENRPPFKILIWSQINQPITAAPAVAGSLVYLTIGDTGLSVPQINNTPTFRGELRQYSTYPSPQLIRDELFLGVTLHNGASWGDVSFPKVINNTAESLYDMMNAVFGPMFVINGGVITEAPLFTLDQSAGTLWQLNRNWQNDHKDPHREAIAQTTGVEWRYTNRDFTTVSALTDTIDASQWDNNGTVEAVPPPGNNASIQRLYEDADSNLWMLWGQVIYDSAQEAASRLNSPIDIPLLLNVSFLLGYAVTEQGKIDWDTDEAFFISGNSRA